MIYEQRIYTCIPGRLPALLKRFEEQTLKIWDKHGIKQAGLWTVLVGEGNHDLHYMLAWESLATWRGALIPYGVTGRCTRVAPWQIATTGG